VTQVSTRQCAWKLESGSRCPEAAKPRGKRGPIPRHCPEHTRARKLAINHHPLHPRSSRPDCCRGGVCQQHKENHAVMTAWKQQDYLVKRLNDDETQFVIDLLSDGYHIDRRRSAGHVDETILLALIGEILGYLWWFDLKYRPLGLVAWGRRRDGDDCDGEYWSATKGASHDLRLSP
jgi:hypothetical protein